MVERLEPWTLVEEETLGRYPIFTLTRSLRHSPGTGRRHRLLRLDANDWVNVLALGDDGRLVLVEQYRHGSDAVTLEIPGGAVDDGEDPAVAAARELEEETGHLAREWHLLGVVDPNPAFLSNRCWSYLALGCTPDGTVSHDPGEEIVVRAASLADFADLIHRGTIAHSLVIAAHHHLIRGLEHGAPWAARVRALPS